MIWKRIVGAVLGAVVVIGSLLPLGYAYAILKDARNPDVASSLLLGLFLGCVGVAGLWIGARFLRFAASGQSQQSNSRVNAVLLGVGAFFPGFAFSYPIVTFWVVRTWPHDDKLGLALGVSVGVGAAVGIVCTVLLLRRVRRAP